MWEPANVTSLPTVQELINAHKAIQKAEIQLCDAVLQLEGLQMRAMRQDRDLEEFGTNRTTIIPAYIIKDPIKSAMDGEYQPVMAKEHEQTPKATSLIIETAELRVNDLRSYLLRIRAWISPIRRLNSDVLSRIFELCAGVDWRSPLRIAVVSRGWRSVVLTTPRAWEFLDLKYCPLPETVQAFIDRGGQRPLHIFLPYEKPLSFLYKVASRLNCLSVDGYRAIFNPEVDQICFPNVEKLYIRGRYTNIRLSNINANYFPSLRYLECMDCFIGGAAGLVDGTMALSPSLKAISLGAGINQMWITIIEHRQDVLVSLKLDLFWLILPHTPRSLQAILPRLKCLDICWAEHMHGNWYVTTPVLETYVQRRNQAQGAAQNTLLHRDIGTILALRLYHEPTLSFLPNLTILQLEGISNLTSVVNQLLSHSELCPQLEHIELLLAETSNSNIYLPETLRGSIRVLNRTRSRPIQLCSVQLETCSPLPGMMPEFMCGPGMPCNDWDKE